MEINSSFLCKLHSKPIVLLCREDFCQCELCLKCVSAHNNHNLVSLEEILDLSEYKKTIEDMKKRLQFTEEKISENIFLIDKLECAFENNRLQYLDFLEKIDLAIKEKIDSLETKTKTKKEKLSIKKKELEKYYAYLEQELKIREEQQEKFIKLIENGEYTKFYEERSSIADFSDNDIKMNLNLSFLEDPVIFLTSKIATILQIPFIFDESERKLSEILKKNTVESNNLEAKRKELDKINKLIDDKAEELENFKQKVKENNAILSRNERIYDELNFIKEIIEKNHDQSNELSNSFKKSFQENNSFLKDILDFQRNEKKSLTLSNETFTLLNQQIIKLIVSISEFTQLRTLEKQSKLERILFTDYKSNMIEWFNTSQAPPKENCLKFLNDSQMSLIAWTGKTSGWLLFDFLTAIGMVKTSIKNGSGIWEIQYSDDNSQFHTCAMFNTNQNEVEWKFVGPHRFWRYNLIKNEGVEFFYGFKWYFIGPYTPPKTVTRFENYTKDMIEWNNPSRYPTFLENQLQFLNDNYENLISWEYQNSGWILFDFKKNMKMIKTRIKSGTGFWAIQYSDNKEIFLSCGSMNITDGQKEVEWSESVGAHRYWRYNLLNNSFKGAGLFGNPTRYFYGYEWFYVN